MFGNINPKQIQGMMKQMGISQQEIPAERVIIETRDKNIIIEEPTVTKINMQGQETWQVSGEKREENKEGFSEEDVSIVAGKAEVSEEEARKALKESKGDIASAIMGMKG
jgi:nascent polypeptide-associated complex subunit alpha